MRQTGELGQSVKREMNLGDEPLRPQALDPVREPDVQPAVAHQVPEGPLRIHAGNHAIRLDNLTRLKLDTTGLLFR